MLLVAGALTILATVTLSINTTILQAYVVSYDSEATIDAISIGQAMVDEIQSQVFDSIAYHTLVTDPSNLTPGSKLGPDLDSEKTALNGRVDTLPYLSAVKFNDVDDYNKYTRIVVSPHLGKFTVADTVYYVQNSNLDISSSTQTWFKKIKVTIRHPNLYQPVVIKSLVVYRRYVVPS
jgi:hypothetical protein